MKAKDCFSRHAKSRAAYRSVLSPNSDGRHDLSQHPASIIEILSLSTDATAVHFKELPVDAAYRGHHYVH